jgi:hypothetical protein
MLACSGSKEAVTGEEEERGRHNKAHHLSWILSRHKQTSSAIVLVPKMFKTKYNKIPGFAN